MEKIPQLGTEGDDEQGIEYVSVKFLLKQVYAAHMAKVKELQDEIKDLKEQLEKKDRELEDFKSGCKRCKELQEAFNNCKATLQQQSKLFENLGQKFSDFGNKSEGAKLESLSLISSFETVNEHSKEGDKSIETVEKRAVKLNNISESKPAKKRTLSGTEHENSNTKNIADNAILNVPGNKTSKLKCIKYSGNSSSNIGEESAEIKKSKMSKKESEVIFSTRKMASLDVTICSGNPINNIDNGKTVSEFDKTEAINSPSLVKFGDGKILPGPKFDNDDFQDSVSNDGCPTDQGAWKSCNKKTLKKPAPTKPIKATSKFKMTLDAPPPNYKKTNYKQTKLSKSIFEPKLNGQSNSPIDSCLELENSEELNGKKILRPIGNMTVKSSTCIDVDATCLPEQFKLDAGFVTSTPLEVDSNLNKVISLGDSDDESLERVAEVILDEDFDNQDKASCLVNAKNSKGANGDAEFKENIDSFDRIPAPEEPNYKYKEDVVRKKSLRKQLDAFGCKECEKYYSGLGLSEEEMKQRMKKCSRHRAKFAPPPTPEHFWEIEFPSTEECKARGYLAETQKVSLKSLRRRPL